MSSKLLPLILFIIWCWPAQAQIQYPPLSAKGAISQEVGFVTIDVEYERPAVRKREIFGELVPWGKVWRTGAGAATKVRFSKPVFINNHTLNAGSYALLTIPNKDSWTVIFNRDTTLVGTTTYNENKDALRFNVRPQHTQRFYESMTIDIDVIPNNAEFYLSWANIQIHFPISTGTNEAIDKLIQSELVNKRVKDWGEFNNAAFYYLWKAEPLKAMNIVHEGIVIAGEKECHLTKARMLEKQGKYNEAIQEVKKEIAAIKEFLKPTGYDLGIATTGFEAYVKELEKKK